jgi:MFS family permease
MAKNSEELGFKNVVRLGYVSLFTDISTEMILGVLPFFIVSQLGATAEVLGLIEGSAEAVNNIFRVFAGVLTDRLGKRKPLVILGYGLSSLAKPLFALATSWQQAFAVRVIDRAGKGTRTSPRDTLISDSVAKSQAGKAFGAHQSLDQIGAVLGPLLAFAAVPFIGIRGVFWLSFIPAAVSLIILIFFVSDSRGLVKQRRLYENAKDVLRNREFVLLLVALGVFSIGAYNFSFILLDAGRLGVQANYIPLVYALLNFATVIIGYPAGILADRAGKLPVLGLSYLVFMITSISGIFLTSNPLSGCLLAIMFGGYMAISDTVQRAAIPDFTKPELKGTAYALYYTMIGFCAFVANSIFGALWTLNSPGTAFKFSVVTSIFGVVALVLFMRRAKKH